MIKQYKSLWIILLCLSVPCRISMAASAGSSSLQTAWQEVVARFEQRLADEHVVGGAIVFTRPAGRWQSFFGVQDLDTRVPVSERTIFHWASITKTFTAIAAMQLAERGQLDLQAPAVRYLPELRAIHNGFGPIEQLRVVHLMTHTSGLRSATWPWGGQEPWHPHEPRHWSQLVAMFPYTGLQFRPGEKFSYSNPGYTFLGRIVEVLSGEDIEAYVDKNVLRPLAMHDSYFDLTPPHLLKYRSNNYYLVNGTAQANGVDFDTGVTSGNGGLNASVADMTRYVEFLGGRGPGGPFPIARSVLQTMWQPVAEVGREPGLVESMGRGFFVLDFDADGDSATPAQRFIGHTGTQMAFRSFIYVDPGSASAVVMAVNTRAMEGYRELYRRTRRDVFELLFSRPRAAAPAATRGSAGRSAR